MTDFLSYLYGNRSGQLCVSTAVRNRVTGRADDFRDKFFALPVDVNRVVEYVNAKRGTHEVYFVPSLLKTDNRNGKTGADVTEGNIVWADFDDGHDPDARAWCESANAIIVDSSEGTSKFHAYLMLPDMRSGTEIETLNDKLRTRFKGDSKYSRFALLRVADTFNHKTDPPRAVRLARTGGVIPVDKLTELEGWAHKERTAVVSTTFDPTNLPVWIQRRFERAATQVDQSNNSQHCIRACAESNVDKLDAMEAVRHYGIDDKCETREGGLEARTRKIYAETQAEILKYERTDLGNAERFADTYRNQLMYVTHHRAWYFWNGSRWEPDTDGVVNRMAHDLTKSVLRAAVELTTGTDSTGDDRWLAFARKSQSQRAVMAVLEMSKAYLSVSADKLNGDPDLLAVGNGTLNLRSGVLFPSKPEDYITVGTDIDYDSEAECPQWLAWLDWFQKGDQDVIGYLQYLVGQSAHGRGDNRILPFLQGRPGSGKTTFTKVIAALLGDYAGTVPVGYFAGNSDLKGGSGHSADLAALAGKRYVVMSETEEDQSLNTSALNQITGGDVIQVSGKGTAPFNMSTAGITLWMHGNHKPRFKGMGDGIWSRCVLIPCNAKTPQGAKRAHFDAELIAKEGAGILAWAVRGVNIQPEVPTQLARATKTFMKESDHIGQFIEDCIELDPDSFVSNPELELATFEWVRHGGQDFRKRNTSSVAGPLVKALLAIDDETKVEAGQRKVNGKNTRGVWGIRLKA